MTYTKEILWEAAVEGNLNGRNEKPDSMLCNIQVMETDRAMENPLQLS